MGFLQKSSKSPVKRGVEEVLGSHERSKPGLRYDKLVVRDLVDLILHLKGPAILVEPDNLERQSLGSLQFFQDRLFFITFHHISTHVLTFLYVFGLSMPFTAVAWRQETLKGHGIGFQTQLLAL